VRKPVLTDIYELMRALERRILEQPGVDHYRRTRDGRALRIPDFLTKGRCHQLGLYNEFYRRMGLKHEIITFLPSPPPFLVAITLNRDGRKDFSELKRLLIATCSAITWRRPTRTSSR
jgi:hypothetical protein